MSPRSILLDSCLINATRLRAWVGTGLLPSGRNTEHGFAEPRCLGEIFQSGTGQNRANGVRKIKEITLWWKGERPEQREEMKWKETNVGTEFSFPSLGAAQGLHSKHFSCYCLRKSHVCRLIMTQ